MKPQTKLISFVVLMLVAQFIMMLQKSGMNTQPNNCKHATLLWGAVMSKPTDTVTFQRFAWANLTFSEAVIIDDIPHLSRKAVGEFLGYASPATAISLLIRRNQHIALHQKQVLVKVNHTSSHALLLHPDGFFACLMASNINLHADKNNSVDDFMQTFATRHDAIADNAKKKNVAGKFSSLAEKENLIKSGKELSLMLGVSMPKVYSMIKMKMLNFPPPAKSIYGGRFMINYYHKQDVLDFMAKFDVKSKIYADRQPNSDGKNSKEGNKFDLASYFRFFGIDQRKTERFGIGKIGDDDDCRTVRRS